MKQAESDIQGSCLILAESLKLAGKAVYLYRTNAGTFRSMDGRRIIKGCEKGHPDISGTVNGKSVYIEMKTPIGKLSQEQKDRRAEILNSGAEWHCIRTIKDFREWILGEI